MSWKSRVLSSSPSFSFSSTRARQRRPYERKRCRNLVHRPPVSFPFSHLLVRKLLLMADWIRDDQDVISLSVALPAAHKKPRLWPRLMFPFSGAGFLLLSAPERRLNLMWTRVFFSNLSLGCPTKKRKEGTCRANPWKGKKTNDWLPILESHACYWEPIIILFLLLRGG